MEEKRYTDKRMDCMETDLREMRADQKEMQTKISEIREKIFNGFSESIEEAHENSKELKTGMKELKEAVEYLKQEVNKTPEQRLLDCPLKKEMLITVERRVKLYLTIGAIVVSLLAGMPSWIRLFIGG